MWPPHGAELMTFRLLSQMGKRSLLPNPGFIPGFVYALRAVAEVIDDTDAFACVRPKPKESGLVFVDVVARSTWLVVRVYHVRSLAFVVFYVRNMRIVAHYTTPLDMHPHHVGVP